MCICLFLYCIFFFKQKTAYDMRISDWSSDVCSSDLGHSRGLDQKAGSLSPRRTVRNGPGPMRENRPRSHRQSRGLRVVRGRSRVAAPRKRSEEHTSELQSLMRISYDVFCLKNKKLKNQQQAQNTHTSTILTTTLKV